MFTNQFKAAVGGIVVIAVGGGLAVGQIQIANKLDKVENQIKMVAVTPTQTVAIATPTASPSATTVPTRAVYVPVVTKAIVK